MDEEIRCFNCNNPDVHWECIEAGGDYFCEECAEEQDFTCTICGSLLIPLD